MILLLNGSFEIGLDGLLPHSVLVLPPPSGSDDEPEYRDIPNIDNPRWWTFWFQHEPGVWDQPEAHLIDEDIRVHEGAWAFHPFTSYRKMNCGLYQRVLIERPMTVELSAYAHAWSNCHDRPHTNDPLWSDGPGYGAGYCLVGEAPNDDWRNFSFGLGIDPTGGTDPRAGRVVWSKRAHIYNEYHQIPPLVGEVNPGYITVFLWVNTLWPFKHNDAYFDSVSLTEVEGPRRGEPRVQYPRTYVLLPPDATLDEAHDALDEHFDERRTIGFSADDAGIGNLDERNVIAYRPDAWPSDLEAFFDEHYAGVNYQPVEEPEPEPEILLWQADPRWRDVRYAGGRCYTIGAQGCWIAACAMAQRYFEIDANATPLTVDALIGSAGYTDGCLMTWQAMPRLGLEVVATTTDVGRVLNWLNDGHVCFAEVLPTSLQHFVMVTSSDYIAPYRFWMFDPWKNVEGWVSNHYAGVESWRLVRRYQEAPTPGPHMEPISFHIQSWQEGPGTDDTPIGQRGYLDAFIADVKPAVVKLVEGMEQAYRIKELSPNTKVVYRHVTSHQGAFVQHPDGPNAGARAGIAEFKDSLLEHAAVIDYIETPANEQIATNDLLGIDECVAFDVAFCEELQAIGLPARPIVLTAGVGNPQHGAQVARLIPAVRAAIMAGGALGYHTYWGCNYDTGRCTMTDGDWEHYAGRALESWDPVFRAAGLFPKYIFGEGGPIGIAPTGNQTNHLAGWRHADCLNGDRDKLVEQILEFRRRINLWNAAHQNRVLGLTLFTVFFQWEWFQYRKEEMDALRLALS